jgi:ferredoxin
MASSYRIELVNSNLRNAGNARSPRELRNVNHSRDAPSAFDAHAAVRSVAVDPRRSILDAAVAAGERLPYSCRDGECGSCVAKLISGTVVHPDATVLTPSQRRRGFILLCLAAPTADCTIEIGLAAQSSMYDSADDD